MSIIMACPVKEDAEKVVNLAHKFDFDFGCESSFKILFNFMVGRKVYKIVDKEGNINWSFTRNRCAHKKAAVMGCWVEADFLEVF